MYVAIYIKKKSSFAKGKRVAKYYDQ